MRRAFKPAGWKGPKAPRCQRHLFPSARRLEGSFVFYGDEPELKASVGLVVACQRRLPQVRVSRRFVGVSTTGSGDSRYCGGARASAGVAKAEPLGERLPTECDGDAFQRISAGWLTFALALHSI